MNIYIYIPASQRTAGRGCEARTKWLPKLAARLLDAMGKNLKCPWYFGQS